MGLAFLLAILGLIYAQVKKKLHEVIANKFDKQEILGATTQANFFGVKSKGSAQVRGNGALVLTKKELYFIRAVPSKEYSIPISAIRKVSLPKTFNGKLTFVPLLCVHYDTKNGEDSIAWALKNAKKWKDAIEKMIT